MESAVKRGSMGLVVAVAAGALAGCVTVRPPVLAPPPAPVPTAAPAPTAALPGLRPQVVINAGAEQVRDAIVLRAQRRGTRIVGETTGGVTLEATLASTAEALAEQCGPHQPGRTIRIYLETVGDGPRRTVVSEDRFIIDGTRVCKVNLTEEDVAQANASLNDLKREAESATAQRPNRGPGAGHDQGRHRRG